jgi:anti-anti-sigma factor
MAEGLEVQVRHDGDVTVLQLSGHLDSTTAASAQERLDDLVGAGAALVLDLSALDYLSSVGLRLILKAMKQAQAGQHPFAIAGAHGRVKEVLDTTGLSRFCPIHARLADAIRSLQ